MTRKERKKAIKVLDDMKVKIDIPKAAKMQNDKNWALDVAIQALSQEQTIQDKQAESEKYQKAFDDGYENGYAQARFDYEQEPCDDTISREAFIKRYDEWMYSEYGKHCEKDALAIRVANSLLSVTQKSGKWLIIDDCEKFIAKCSECGRIEDSRMISKYPYCHCGARMKSGDK